MPPHSHPRTARSLVNVHVTQLLQVVSFTPIDHYPLRHEVVVCGIDCEKQLPEGSEYVSESVSRHPRHMDHPPCLAQNLLT